MPASTSDPDWQTRPAAGTDLSWLIEIGKATNDANGFTPRSAIADHIERGDYTILDLAGQRAAFMFTSGGKRSPFRIVQSAVSLELWRQGYGQALFGAVALRAILRPNPSTRCAVGDRLQSNAFWMALGAVHVDTTNPPNVRKRAILHYTWRTAAIHHHATIAATDERHRTHEREIAQRIIETHGFLPQPQGKPRTPTSDARHGTGIALPIPSEPWRKLNTPPPTVQLAACVVPPIDEAPFT